MIQKIKAVFLLTTEPNSEFPNFNSQLFPLLCKTVLVSILRFPSSKIPKVTIPTQENLKPLSHYTAKWWMA